MISKLLVLRANLIEFDFTGREFKILAICPSGHLISGHGPCPLFFGGTIGANVVTSSITAAVGGVVVVVVVVVIVGQLISSSGQS